MMPMKEQIERKKRMGRVLCWSTRDADVAEGVQVVTHRPEKKNLALVCDDAWEGACNGYATVLRVPGGYRMYYRATTLRRAEDGSTPPYTSVICVAESRDGLHFEKPSLGLFEYNGSRENNIVWATPDFKRDTFSVMYDDSPECPPDERFRALTEQRVGGDRWLLYLSSADGYRFVERGTLDVRGTMDSYNAVFRDPTDGLYRLYYRAFHDREGRDLLELSEVDPVCDVRDVRLATSPDFLHWTEHGRIAFEAGQSDLSLYTNQISKYDRDGRTYLGFPVRYTDRAADAASFLQMPLSDYRARIIERYGREGSALTDCLIMTSTDGRLFDRRDEAYFTPGAESATSWWYGDCYPAYGMIETPADEPGASTEFSMYMGENYRIKNVDFRRYTLRLDGFFSWFAPFSGGRVLTRPFVCQGDTLELNLATSAAGGVRVSVCDADGTPLEGYRSALHFGDSTARRVDFERPLSLLRGKPLRLEFLLCDAHLYSYCLY